jgi:enterochelin esterase-like enzyme
MTTKETSMTSTLELAAPVDSARLAAALSGGPLGLQDAIDALWEEVAASGAPLMEPIDDDTTLVTFLWRDPGDTDNALVLFFSAPTDGDFSDFLMTHVPGTDLWFRSYPLPSGLRTTYLFSVNDSLIPFTSYAQVLEQLPRYRTDPLNPRDYTLLSAPNEFKVSVLELPAAPKQPWNLRRKGVRRGEVSMHQVTSRHLGSEHHLAVYLPPGYDPGRPDGYDVLVLFDGWSYYNFASVTTILDNLLHVGRIPPYVLVMHTNEDQDIRATELPCHEPFHRFLIDELMPWVGDRYHVTDDPARTVLAGSCFGGLAAAHAALRSPGRFGNVISQSGSFWWPHGPDGEQLEGLIEEYAQADRLPVRFSLEIGSLEKSIIDYDPMSAHRRMRDVLLAKGYTVDYHEYSGGHDMVCWRGSLVDRLLSFHPRPDRSAVGPTTSTESRP